MPRTRLFLVANTVAGQSETISISRQLPFNAALIQWTVKFGAVPTTPEDFTITRNTTVPGIVGSVAINLVTLDPTVEGLSKRICNPTLQFKRGDVVEAAYANTDDIESFVELVFREAS